MGVGIVTITPHVFGLYVVKQNKGGKMKEHYEPFSTVLHRILVDFEGKKINLYKAKFLIQEEIKYCNARDERLRKEKQQVWIDSQNEINRV